MSDNFFKSSFGASGSGKNGAKGSQGTQGLTGNIGSQGTQGTQGTLGGQGIQGLQGNTQAQGIQGIAGIGTSGSQGIQGAFGNKGLSYWLGNETNPQIQRTNRSTNNSNGTATYVANRLYFHYFQLAFDYTITDITFFVSASAGTNMRILIYDNNDGVGRPNNLLYESVNVDCSVGGFKTIILPSPFTFIAGKAYFLAWYASGSVSCTGNILMFNWDSSNNSVTNPSNTSNMGNANSAQTDVTFGSAPNPFGSPVVTLNTSTPNSMLIWFNYL